MVASSPLLIKVSASDITALLMSRWMLQNWSRARGRAYSLGSPLGDSNQVTIRIVDEKAASKPES